MQNPKPLVAALPKIIRCLIAFPASLWLRSIVSMGQTRSGGWKSNQISASSTNWQPQQSGRRAMKTGLCHPACQSRGAPGGMGICHRLRASPGAAAASPAEGNKDRKVGREKVGGGLTSRNMLLSQPGWKS